MEAGRLGVVGRANGRYRFLELDRLCWRLTTGNIEELKRARTRDGLPPLAELQLGEETDQTRSGTVGQDAIRGLKTGGRSLAASVRKRR